MPNRRTFLGGIAAGGAGALAAAPPAPAQTPAPAPSPTPADALRAGARERAADDGGAVEITVRDAGSDFMVDVFKTLDLEYVAANPGSTFRGLHESLINYGGNARPEFITCTHEEISVALAHGYAKASGKPMMALVHSNVGLQHASMAVYNAWADRVPVMIVAGNVLDETKRRPGAEWFHSAQDPGAIIRATTKWDDQPLSLQHFADSAVRAYRAAVTPPMGPVFLALDGDLQEAPAGAQRAGLRIPAYRAPIPPAGDPNALEAVAKLLVGAQSPVVVCDRSVRTQAGMNLLVTLAETLAAPVLDRGGRLNFPSRHWCN
ncbi:MAG: thiamine pyrophosphate-binding protein, partial [Candidatus Velthaea sp.]